MVLLLADCNNRNSFYSMLDILFVHSFVGLFACSVTCSCVLTLWLPVKSVQWTRATCNTITLKRILDFFIFRMSLDWEFICDGCWLLDSRNVPTTSNIQVNSWMCEFKLPGSLLGFLFFQLYKKQSFDSNYYTPIHINVYFGRHHNSYLRRSPKNVVRFFSNQFDDHIIFNDMLCRTMGLEAYNLSVRSEMNDGEYWLKTFC